MNKSCHLCQSINIYKIDEVNHYNLFRCLDCHVVFIHPQPSIKTIEKNNLNIYTSDKLESVYLSMKDTFNKRAKLCIATLKKFKSEGKLLDVGCSYGFYLKAFNQQGYSAWGIDISKRAVEYAKVNFKVRAIHGNFEKYIFDEESFDVVTLFDVFEHFSDPIHILKKINWILKRNGILIIQTPNYDSLISKITGKNWSWLLIPEHLFIYTLRTLEIILKNNEFRIIKVFTWDDLYEFVNNIINIQNNRYSKNIQFLQKILIRASKIISPISYPEKYFSLGGAILVYAQKK